MKVDNLTERVDFSKTAAKKAAPFKKSRYTFYKHEITPQKTKNPRAFRLVPILDGFEIYEVICQNDGMGGGDSLSSSRSS